MSSEYDEQAVIFDLLGHIDTEIEDRKAEYLFGFREFLDRLLEENKDTTEGK